MGIGGYGGDGDGIVGLWDCRWGEKGVLRVD